MSCLPDCGCSQDIKEEPPHEEYRPLSESIPLLRKESNMITYEADAGQYALMAIIGKGLSGAATISVAQHVPTGQKVAIRRTNLDSLSGEDITYIQNEVLVTRQLRHDNLLPYHCSFVFQQEVWSVMPLITYGSARDVMAAEFPEGLPEVSIGLILRDILSALEYIHGRGFIHRGIKASHVLIAASGRALLTGLRYSTSLIRKGKWSKVLHSFPPDCIPNLNWLSPELLEQNLVGYDAKSDIYSLGITLCEMANGIVPFAEMPPTQMLLEKLQGYHPRPLDAQTYYEEEEEEEGGSQSAAYRTRHFSDHFHDLTEICLERDPRLRPTASQLLRHSFLKQCRKSHLSLSAILAGVSPIAQEEGGEEGLKMQELSLGTESQPSWTF